MGASICGDPIFPFLGLAGIIYGLITGFFFYATGLFAKTKDFIIWIICSSASWLSASFFIVVSFGWMTKSILSIMVLGLFGALILLSGVMAIYNNKTKSYGYFLAVILAGFLIPVIFAQQHLFDSCSFAQNLLPLWQGIVTALFSLWFFQLKETGGTLSSASKINQVGSNVPEKLD